MGHGQSLKPYGQHFHVKSGLALSLTLSFIRNHRLTPPQPIDQCTGSLLIAQKSMRLPSVYFKHMQGASLRGRRRPLRVLRKENSVERTKVHDLLYKCKLATSKCQKPRRHALGKQPTHATRMCVPSITPHLGTSSSSTGVYQGYVHQHLVSVIYLGYRLPCSAFCLVRVVVVMVVTWWCFSLAGERLKKH